MQCEPTTTQPGPKPSPALLLDDGIGRASRHLACDQIWLALRARNQCPDLLRFYRTHSCASVGRFQAIDRELRLEHCTNKGVDVVRRITGGGALYIDPQQLGFSLVQGNIEGSQEAHLRAACSAIVTTLSGFGLEAAFKFPNDVEIAGRKIASVFAVMEQGVLLLQGIVLLDVEIRAMLEALRVPTEKLSPDGLAAARDRFAPFHEVCLQVPDNALQQALKTQLAQTFSLTLRASTPDEEILPEDITALEIKAHDIDWSEPLENHLEALWKTSSGILLRARAAFTPEGTIRDIEFASDLQAANSAFLTTLQGALRNIPATHIEEAIRRQFGAEKGNMPGASADDFLGLVLLLIDKQRGCDTLGLDRQQASRLMIHSPGKATAGDILDRASVMLVPYCAKPAWCEWRHQDECTECGLCEVGEAYRLGRERGMTVKTIVRYEHLVETLKEIKSEGASAYMGMCCSHFFIKRHRAFREADMDALLMDIDGANCYELKQEDQAYAGTFQAEAILDETLLHKIMAFVPGEKSGVSSAASTQDTPTTPEKP